VEVLDGNQSDPSRAQNEARGASSLKRRKGDRPDDQRNLTWVTRDSDIALCPHSPLAIADVLSSKDGTFVLVATADDVQCNAAVESNSVVSMHKHRKLKNPRNRANLLTQHDSSQLPEQCRQVLVDNALVKQPGQRRLYLAAGFINIQIENDATPFRAPLLFYPVILAHGNPDETQEHADSTDYVIRVDNPLPETNPTLHAFCSDHMEITLPVYDAEQPLQDYFAHVAAAIGQHKELNLEFDIALGSCAPPHGSNLPEPDMPKLPANFDAKIAKTITDNKTLEELGTVLNLLRDYSLPSARVRAGVHNAQGSAEISELREYSVKLATVGVDHIEFQRLPELPAKIRSWVKSAEKALRSETVRKCLKVRSISVRHLIKLSSVIELLDKSPAHLEQYRHADLSFSATPGLLRRARHQSRLIEDELASLQSYFVLDKVPAKPQLLSLIEELGGKLDTGPDIVDAEYFNARRQFMEFSIEKPANLTPEHQRTLSKLAKVLRFRELFVNNTEYRLALGPGYRGLRTDWDQLEEILDYSQEFATVLESESIAASALGNWPEFRNAFVAELELLQISADALYRLIRIIGPNWQHKSVDVLLSKALETADQLQQWHTEYGEAIQYPGRTPASVLSQFTGKSREDVITEIHVGETQAQIDKGISVGQTTTESVVDTIKWLREASDTALANQLDIEAIVEHARTDAS
jgi:hypothetical protein